MKSFAALMLISPALLFGQNIVEEPFTPSSTGVEARISGPDLSDYVSPNLDPAEQAFMRTYMNALSVDAKLRIFNTSPDNVSIAIVDGSTGIIHYNRPEDVGRFEVGEGLSLPGDERPSVQNDELSSGLPLVKNPGVFGGSGPYRRVYTNPVLPIKPIPGPAGPGEPWGDYSVSGWVTTSCKAGKFATTDTGYTYLGGWSGKWDMPNVGAGSVVDAGLQYSATRDDYAMFMNLGKPIGTIHQSNFSGSKQPSRIACGALTHLIFTIISTVLAPNPPSECLVNGKQSFVGPSPACTTYALQLEANSAHVEGRTGIVEQFILWIAPSVDTGGWAELVKFTGDWNLKHNQTLYRSQAPCGNCSFKWMTSIAQKKENLADGSTFTATWSQREITDYAFGGTNATGAHMVSITPGITDCSEYPLWHSPYGTPYNADCKNTPSSLKGLSQTVKVTSYTPGGEADSISAKY